MTISSSASMMNITLRVSQGRLVRVGVEKGCTDWAAKNVPNDKIVLGMAPMGI